jgi:hypothetical protein
MKTPWPRSIGLKYMLKDTMSKLGTLFLAQFFVQKLKKREVAGVRELTSPVLCTISSRTPATSPKGRR